MLKTYVQTFLAFGLTLFGCCPPPRRTSAAASSARSCRPTSGRHPCAGRAAHWLAAALDVLVGQRRVEGQDPHAEQREAGGRGQGGDETRRALTRPRAERSRSRTARRQRRTARAGRRARTGAAGRGRRPVRRGRRTSAPRRPQRRRRGPPARLAAHVRGGAAPVTARRPAARVGRARGTAWRPDRSTRCCAMCHVNDRSATRSSGGDGRHQHDGDADRPHDRLDHAARRRRLHSTAYPATASTPTAASSACWATDVWAITRRAS